MIDWGLSYSSLKGNQGYTNGIVVIQVYWIYFLPHGNFFRNNDAKRFGVSQIWYCIRSKMNEMLGNVSKIYDATRSFIQYILYPIGILVVKIFLNAFL